MLPTILQVTALLLAAASTAWAHATMFSVSVNGKDQGDGRNKYIRSPPDHGPVLELESAAIACNVNGGTPAPSFVKASAGDKLSFRWFHANPDDPKDILDPSHLGAILTYIAPYTEDNGAKGIWSKIHHDGYENGKWATIRMIDNGGRVEFTLPKALKKGKYLIRQELLALHKADFSKLERPDRGPESYPSCVQFEVEGGGGDKVPDQNFDFQKGYKYDDPGMHFNVHYPVVPYDSYVPPGPKVWSPN